MESKRYFKKENGIIQYTNEIYNLTISNNGDVNLGRKTADPNAIIGQLIDDLSRTAIHMQHVLNAIEVGAKQGFVSEEYANQLSAAVCDSENDKPLKK